MGVKRGLIGVGAGILLIGVGMSVRDWQVWQRTEKENYGHGYEDNREPAKPLTKIWGGNSIGLRLRLPEEWEVVTYVPSPGKLSHEQIKAWGKFNGGMVEVSEKAEEGNLPDIMNQRVKELTQEGVVFTQDRRYINAANISWEVIDYRKGELIIEEARAKKDQKIYMVNSVMTFSQEIKWAKTLEEIYRQAVGL